MKNRIAFLCAVSFPFLVVACLTDPDCIKIEDSALKVVFIDEDDLSTDTLIVNKIFVFGLEDSPIVENDSITRVLLPLNLDSTAMTYVINSVQGVDTFAVTYTANNRLITPECGLNTSFDDLELGEATFDPDNLILVDPRVLNNVETNIQILF